MQVYLKVTGFSGIGCHLYCEYPPQNKICWM